MDRFGSLLAVVTGHIKSDCPGRSRLWLSDVIDEFDREFLAWRSKPPVRDFIEKLDDLDDLHPLTALIGDAFLHMGYDLPRALAKHLPKLFTGDREQLLPLTAPGPNVSHTQSRMDDLWDDFLALDQVMIAAWMETMSKPEIFGRWYAVASEVLGTFRLTRPLLESMALWAVVMRREAWHNAEKIQVWGDEAASDQMLWRSFLLKAEPLFRPKGSPAEMITLLRPPQLYWPSTIKPARERIEAL